MVKFQEILFFLKKERSLLVTTAEGKGRRGWCFLLLLFPVSLSVMN